jgi:hypothetical protein
MEFVLGLEFLHLPDIVEVDVLVVFALDLFESHHLVFVVLFNLLFLGLTLLVVHLSFEFQA